MKFSFSFFFLFSFLVLLINENKTFALTDYEIKRICLKEKRRSYCIKILQNKRLNLINGRRIEIPVIPHKN